MFELADRGPLVQALRALRSRPGLALLDSAAGEPKRFSLLGFDPLPLALEPERGVFGLRDAQRELAPAAGDSVPGFFAGGLLAALAYDLGVAGETRVVMPPEPWGFPLLLGGLYVDFLVRDERAERTWLVLGDEPGDGRASVERRRAVLEAELARVPAPNDAPRGAGRSGELVRWTSSAEHRARIERCRAAIGRGELYQANLAHRFTCEVRGDPVELYAKLRERNPAPYMGFLSFDSADPKRSERRGALLSCSPELFLEVGREIGSDLGAKSAGEIARTRPIKGTIARSADPAEDARRRAALLASEKDLAELVMIVDLERNDLGRVARPGSVRVEGYPTLASYARVHHLMADVVAEPRPGVDAFDLVAALFPGGSISGCPKLAALAHIAELEGEGRGFFCGSLGAFSLDGRANLNVLIRTLQWRPLARDFGEVSFRVGGGITFSSDASAEDRETLAKAAGIVDALDAP
ncbi:MAG: anthranilate synthase component I family protein [Planctomycetes bacterium]|nr:anthranilate synthase component I family protein [Planctomycetota bacterium]